MKIKLISDVHLLDSKDFLDSELDYFDGVLIIAGDLFNSFIDTYKINVILEKLSDYNKHVIYVLGNHEYYSWPDRNILEINKYMKRTCSKHGINLLDRSNVIIEGIQFIGCTLWSSLDNNNPISCMNARNSLNDFNYIYKVGETNITTNDYLQLHKLDLNYLETTVLKDTVVITHHLPSFMSISNEYKGNLNNGCFATELSNLIYSKAPKLWIHGHTHTACDYNMANKISETRVICKPCNLNGFIFEI